MTTPIEETNNTISSSVSINTMVMIKANYIVSMQVIIHIKSRSYTY